MKTNAEIEALRQEMYMYIALYGIQDKRTLEASQRLDKPIVEVMKGDGGK